MKLTTVNYFDLGCHEGFEIDDLLGIADGMPDIDIHVYGIEANPRKVKHCCDRFASDNRVQIHNFAVGLEDGRADLFLASDSSGLGSSIYADKTNVTQNKVCVPQHRLSTWLQNMGFLPRPARTINIIKANIEGAEWDLICDLDRRQLFGCFDLYCGAKGGWITDMRKIPSLQPHIETAAVILEKHGIQIYKYFVSRKFLKNGKRVFIKNVIDMRNAIAELLRGEKLSGKTLEEGP